LQGDSPASRHVWGGGFFTTIAVAPPREWSPSEGKYRGKKRKKHQSSHNCPLKTKKKTLSLLEKTAESSEKATPNPYEGGKKKIRGPEKSNCAKH